MLRIIYLGVVMCRTEYHDILIQSISVAKKERGGGGEITPGICAPSTGGWERQGSRKVYFHIGTRVVPPDAKMHQAPGRRSHLFTPGRSTHPYPNYGGPFGGGPGNPVTLRVRQHFPLPRLRNEIAF